MYDLGVSELPCKGVVLLAAGVPSTAVDVVVVVAEGCEFALSDVDFVVAA